MSESDAIMLTIVVGYGIWALYLLTLFRAFSQVHPSRRTLASGLVWLNLIPVLNIFWHFVTVVTLSGSIKREFSANNVDVGSSPGLISGLVFSIVFLLAGISGVSPIAILTGLLALIFWIVYWVSIAGWRRQLVTVHDVVRARGG